MVRVGMYNVEGCVQQGRLARLVERIGGRRVVNPAASAHLTNVPAGRE